MAKKFVKTKYNTWANIPDNVKEQYKESIVFLQKVSAGVGLPNGGVIYHDGVTYGDNYYFGNKGILVDNVSGTIGLELKSKGGIFVENMSGEIGLSLNTDSDLMGTIHYLGIHVDNVSGTIGLLSSGIVGVKDSVKILSSKVTEVSSNNPTKVETEWIDLPSTGTETTIEYTSGDIDMKGGQIKQNGTIILDDDGNLSSATISRVGGIKVSSVNTSNVVVNSESTTAGRYYPIVLNSDGKAIVNVPWSDTLNCQYRTTTNTSATTSISLEPNIMRKFSNVLAANLTITLASASSTTTVNEYMIEFSFGSTLYQVTFPSTIKWAYGQTPTFKVNKTYQISIVNNLAVFLEF